MKQIGINSDFGKYGCQKSDDKKNSNRTSQFGTAEQLQRSHKIEELNKLIQAKKISGL